MSLSTKQKRFLRGLSHQLHPVVAVAGKGLSENVMAELDAAFTKHELIKVKLRAEKDQREQWIDQIQQQFKAERIHVIGQVVCFYKKNAKEAVISLAGKD